MRGETGSQVRGFDCVESRVKGIKDSRCAYME